VTRERERKRAPAKSPCFPNSAVVTSAGHRGVWKILPNPWGFCPRRVSTHTGPGHRLGLSELQVPFCRDLVGSRHLLGLGFSPIKSFPRPPCAHCLRTGLPASSLCPQPPATGQAPPGDPSGFRMAAARPAHRLPGWRCLCGCFVNFDGRRSQSPSAMAFFPFSDPGDGRVCVQLLFLSSGSSNFQF
jgi:hypothetical protein